MEEKERPLRVRWTKPRLFSNITKEVEKGKNYFGKGKKRGPYRADCARRARKEDRGASGKDNTMVDCIRRQGEGRRQPHRSGTRRGRKKEKSTKKIIWPSRTFYD